MALYGVNAYMSNSYYTSLLSGNRYGSSNKSAANSTSDLLSLMKRADEVRSRSYQKSMIEEYRKVFSGESEIGSLENEQSLSENAGKLNASASALATASNSDISDREGLKKSVQTFIDDYNATIDSMKKSNSVDALKKGLAMTNTTKAYARALSRSGIKVGSDNKLTFDEENFNEAPDGALRSMFNGSYSFANKTADKAADISRSAALKAQLTYNSQGMLDYSTKVSLNSMFSELI